MNFYQIKITKLATFIQNYLMLKTNFQNKRKINLNFA